MGLRPGPSRTEKPPAGSRELVIARSIFRDTIAVYLSLPGKNEA